MSLLTAGVGLALGLGLQGTTRTAIFTLFVIGGFLFGGFRTGIECRQSPLTNGAAAAALAYIPMAIIRFVQSVSDDERVPWGSVVFAVLLAASLGTFGAMLAGRARRRQS